MSKRINFPVLGRAIGTVTGWDEADDYCIILHNFIPSAGLPMPTGELVINYDRGLIQTFGDGGVETFQADMVEALRHLPRSVE